MTTNKILLIIGGVVLVLGLVVASSRTPLASAVLVVAIITGFAVSYVRARAEGLIRSSL